jgi:hypothetical protein
VYYSGHFARWVKQRWVWLRRGEAIDVVWHVEEHVGLSKYNYIKFIILNLWPYLNLIEIIESYSNSVPRYCNCIIIVVISYHVKYVHCD